MGEVTPETINGLTSAGLWLVDTVDTYGPGLTAAAIAWAGWWGIGRAADWRDRRREQRGIRHQIADEQRGMARLSAAIEAAPLQPTQPRQLVDAAPVRQHILDLQEAGIGPTRVARYAGLPHTTISNFLRAQPSRGRGRKQQTTPETAEKILAVRAVTTTGTIRRIQALIAVGWPARRIAAHAGVSTRWLTELRDTTVVNIITSDKITAAYQELRRLKPETNGVHTGHARRSRQRAADNRWPTPKYWDQHADDLDDPHFIPEYRKLRAEILAEEAHWLMTAGGLDRDQAAARLGIARFTIDRALREHPQDEQELAA